MKLLPIAALLLPLIPISASAAIVPGTALEPDLWLKDAAANFDGTTWTATNGPDAVPLGQGREAVFGAPTLATQSPASGVFSGRTLSGLLFDSTVADLLVAADAGPAGAFNATTLFMVYQSASTSGTTRAGGFGAFQGVVSGEPDNNVFNPSLDGTFRYDNGFNDGGALSTEMFVRTSVLAPDGRVSDYLNGTITSMDDDPTGGSFTGNISSPDFYIGDLRRTDADEVFVVEVITFNRELSAQEIADVNAYLATIPEPSTILLGTTGLLLVTALVYRARKG